jgi:hypothetical protein
VNLQLASINPVNGIAVIATSTRIKGAHAHVVLFCNTLEQHGEQIEKVHDLVLCRTGLACSDWTEPAAVTVLVRNILVALACRLQDTPEPQGPRRLTLTRPQTRHKILDTSSTTTRTSRLRTSRPSVLANFGTARDHGFTSLMPTMTTVLMPMTLMMTTEFLLPLRGAYRVCFSLFLCFLRLHTWRARHSQPLFATRTRVLKSASL